MGQFTQSGIEELSNQAHTLEVYCQIPPHYGNTKSSILFSKKASSLELDINCSDNNNVNVEYLQSPRVHVKPSI
jgi:hypothetical protein